MGEPLLFGWTAGTWKQVLEWAGEDGFPVFLHTDFSRLASVRRKWLKAGGPVSGPISGLVFTSG